MTTRAARAEGLSKEPAAATGDSPNRVEGMLLTGGGHIGLTTYFVPWFVSLTGSLPERDAGALLMHLSEVVPGTPWLEKWRWSTSVEPAEVLASLRAEGERLPAGLAEAFDSLCSSLANGGFVVEGDSLV